MSTIRIMKLLKKYLPTLFFITSLGIFIVVSYLYRHFMTNIDENDHIVASYLMSQGKLVYTDFFTNHFPFPYYFVSLFNPLWIDAPLNRAISVFRFTLTVLYLGSFIAIYLSTKNYLLKVLISVFILLSALIMPLYHGNLVLSEVYSAIFITMVAWIAIPVALKIEKLTNTKLILIIIASSLGFWTQPLLGLLFFSAYFLLPFKFKDYLKVTIICAVINVIPIIYFFFSNQLLPLLNQGVIFNSQVYANFFPEKSGDSSMMIQNIQDFFPNEITLLTNLSNTVGFFQFSIHLLALILLGVLIKMKKYRALLIAVLLFLVTRIREIKIVPGELFNFGIFPFLLLSIVFALFLFSFKNKIINILTGVLLSIFIITGVMLTQPIFIQSLDKDYNYHVFWSDRQTTGNYLSQLSVSSAKLLVYPHDVDYYYIAKRQPIDSFTYWFPWLDSVEEFKNERQEAFVKTPPSVIYLGNVAYHDNPNYYLEIFPNLLSNYQQIECDNKKTNIWIANNNLDIGRLPNCNIVKNELLEINE